MRPQLLDLLQPYGSGESTAPREAREHRNLGPKPLLAREARLADRFTDWHGVSYGQSHSCADPVVARMPESHLVWTTHVHERPITDREPNLPQLREAIVALSERKSLEAAKRIDEIRESVDELGAAAEARLRVTLKSLTAPALAPEAPAWFVESVRLLPSHQLDKRVVASAERLVRAVVAAVGAAGEGRCELANDGTLEVVWESDSCLTWLVGRSRLPWPGINVRAYARHDANLPAMRSRSFQLAHRAIEHAASRLRT